MQLSAGNTHTKSQQDACTRSSVSSGTCPLKKQLLNPADINAIQDAGMKIFVLCIPWSEWTVSGHFLVGSKVDPTTITASNSDGEAILSHIPPSSMKGFLLRAGQSVVSDHYFLYY